MPKFLFSMRSLFIFYDIIKIFLLYSSMVNTYYAMLYIQIFLLGLNKCENYCKIYELNLWLYTNEKTPILSY